MRSRSISSSSDEYYNPNEELAEKLKNSEEEGIEDLIREQHANLHSPIVIDGKISYPIHLAIENYDNPKILRVILDSFSNSTKRQNYINLKDSDGYNAFDLAVQSEKKEFLEIILSFLTTEEQKVFCDNAHAKLTEDFLEDYDEDEIPSLDSLEIAQNIKDLISGKTTVQPLAKRLVEEDLEYDSDEEGLDAIGEVESKKGFVARVWYKKSTVNGQEKQIPMIELIPSSWRLETGTEDSNQGDHVIAYVLLLQSLSHCSGQYIKTLPQKFCEMACAVLPDNILDFTASKLEVQKTIADKREVRKDAIANLKHHHGKDYKYLLTLEQSLKKAEVEEVARYIEREADCFIKIINRLEKESFSRTRKEKVNQDGFLTGRMCALVDSNLKLSGTAFETFRNKLKAAITQGLNGRTEIIDDKDLSKITEIFLNSLDGDVDESPEGLSDKKSFKEFLVSITPLKKYHEGRAIKRTKELIGELKIATSEAEKTAKVNEMGKNCFRLFDYGRVDKADCQFGDELKRHDDEFVLYEAIPRHMAIFFAAFREIKELSAVQKSTIYENFLDHVLDLQLWGDFEVTDLTGNQVRLSKSLLKERVAQFSSIDENGDFTLKPNNQHPAPAYSGLRKPVVYDFGEIEAHIEEKKADISSWMNGLKKLCSRKRGLSDVAVKINDELQAYNAQFLALEELNSFMTGIENSLTQKQQGYDEEKKKFAELKQKHEEFKKSFDEMHNLSQVKQKEFSDTSLKAPSKTPSTKSKSAEKLKEVKSEEKKKDTKSSKTKTRQSTGSAGLNF